MPGTTKTRETRASRSRFSSPQVNTQSPNGTSEQQSKGPAAGLDNQKAFMARWLEPPVTVKPSYQDAGLMRHGVVEGMAPLGTLPKVGIFKKTAAPAGPDDAPPQNTPPPTRIVLKQRVKPTATPKQAPAPVTPAAQTEDDTEEVEDSEESEDSDDEDEGLIAPPPLPTSRRRQSIRNDDDDDGDWAPAGPRTVSVGTKSINTRRSVSRARAASISQTSPSMQHTQTSASSVSRVMESIKDVADKVVEAAVEEAIKHYRYPTAWALRMLYDENSDKDEFLSMVQEVFTQTADAETVEQFARLLNAKKKDGKKGNKGFLYFIPPATSNASVTLHKPKRAPYGNLVRLEVPQVGADREQTMSEQGQEQEGEPEPEPESAREPVQEEEAPKQTPSKKRKKLPEEPQPRIDETPAKKRRKLSSKHSESATPAAKAMASTGKKKKTGSTPATGNGKAKLTESPSMRRKARAASIASSSSSLSSARSLTPPDGIMDSDGDVDVADVPPSRASPAAETSDNANAPTAPQPIARPKRNNAPKKKRNVAPTTPTPSSPATIPPATTNNNNTTTTRSQQQTAAAATAASSMPALIEPPIFPNLPPPKKSAYKAAGANQDKNIPVFASRVGRLDDNDEKIRLRQKAKNVTNGLNLPESYGRHVPDEQEKHPHPERARLDAAARAGGDAARTRPRPTRVSGAATVFAEAVNGNLNAASRSTRSSRKRSHDEVDDEVSPTTVHFPPGALDDASTAATSRAETPILRPAKKTKTGARVKQSPMKKKNGTSAGIPRPSGERSSPAPIGAVQDDNDDYCSSCGGNGELLCCDGCTRAFHLNCVDPPIFEDRMPADWFCNVCLSDRNSFGPHSGAFRSLLESLEPKNSSAFRLPLVIRDYFEGVRTGVDGEYEEIVAVQKPSRKKKVEEEAPDFFRLRDNEGNSIICHLCSKPTADNRAIVPCSVCGLWWHIDCLDPPLAHPPVLRTWRCPAHVDDLLAKIPGVRGPAHRFRKIKGAADVTPAYSRGNINNGWIEVIDDESEDESGYKDRNTFGRVQHLRGKGIEEDFMYKVRKNRKGKPIAPLAAAFARPVTPQAQAVDLRTVEMQQAALNLAQLSGQGTAGIDTLVDTLLANADPSVISLMARANPRHIEAVANLNQSDQQGLRAMLAQLEAVQAQVKELLMCRGELPSPATPNTADKLPEDHRRRSTPGRPFDALVANLPADSRLLAAAAAASESTESKELPSPPATDMPDEKARLDSEQDVIVAASDSPSVEVEPEAEEDSMDME